jgi:hypothetical protein
MTIKPLQMPMSGKMRTRMSLLRGLDSCEERRPLRGCWGLSES